jgi:type I restriction enzyme S subunit
MVENRRICLDLSINSRTVNRFEGEKTYISTGDSDDMDNAGTVTFYNRPSRANVEAKIGDIIFAKMANTSKTFLIDEKLSQNIYSTGFFNVSSKKIHPKFLYYLITSDEFDVHKNVYSEGTTQLSISDKRLRKIKLTYETDIDKQKRIADYLSEKCNIIDELISQLQKSINELKKLSKSIIAESVVKGIDSCKLIPCNNGLVDCIPEHWSFSKLGFLGQLSNGISKGSEFFGYGHPFVNYVDVYNNLSLPKPTGLIDSTLEERSLYSVKKGDIFFTRTSETIDEVGFSSVCEETIENACFAGFLIRFRPKKESPLYTGYAKYYFRNSYLRKFIDKNLMIVTRASLPQSLLRNIVVLLPPYDEQIRIAAFLDKKIGEIDELISHKNKKIQELTEYRRSLIYEYVSGRKEVL